MEDCIFCQIVEGKIPSRKVYEDEEVLAFHDVSPVAPVHILVIPKKHIDSVLRFDQEDLPLAGNILYALQKVAHQQQLEEKGFRVVTNTGKEGGQTVGHVHFHLLGGRNLAWPPG